jgi:hypothetical protein
MQPVNLPRRNGTTVLRTASTAIAPDRVSRAKAAYTTRRVDLGAVEEILTGEIAPKAGDLVLARIERLGQHARIELASGRRAHLHVGDEIIVAYGARYAPDQFEAYVPGDLGPCDLVAAGGVASECKVKHSRMKNPTCIHPIGLLAYANGQRVNLSDWALPKVSVPECDPKVFAVVGTMMNAGKTTCAANLVHGLKRKGLRVGAAKITGTGSGGDRWLLTDAGAEIVLDFTDAGEPSTFGLSAARVEEIFTDLTDHLAAESFDAIVLEIADGLFQRETANLLKSDLFRARCDGLLFAAGDALGALAGVQHLEKLGHTVLAAGGAMTASPLAIREAVQVLDIPVVTSKDLATARWLPLVENASEAIGAAIVKLPKELPGLAEVGHPSRHIKWMNGGSAVQVSA